MEPALKTIRIEEPQQSYLLELLTELGDAALDFVMVGGHVIRLMVQQTRKTKDFDFILDVLTLRNRTNSLATTLDKLQYQVLPEAQRFQFAKNIPNSHETIRIEFLASDKKKRGNDIRVSVQKGIHARSCVGSEIAIKESELYLVKGLLPNGKPVEAKLKVIRLHALLMLKLFAMYDRYLNIRGPKEARHDREEARIHAGDIIAIVRANIQSPEFIKSFWTQFDDAPEIKHQIRNILETYFADLTSPGVLLYAELLNIQSVDVAIATEETRVLREMQYLLSQLSE